MSTSHTLLLVDDDADDRELFLLALSRLGEEGLSCQTANNGPEALRKLSSGDVQPDLIFLDLNMPLMTGHQLLQLLKMRDETRDIPVVILSTATDAHSIAQARQLGASCFFSKPVKMQDWSTMLRSAMSVLAA
jgi:CheY-like chemotaxis protein